MTTMTTETSNTRKTSPAPGSEAYYRHRYHCSRDEARTLAGAWQAGLAARRRWNETQPQPRKEG